MKLFYYIANGAAALLAPIVKRKPPYAFISVKNYP